MNLPKPLAALAHRNFRIYWVGQAISLVGTWMQVMALNWVLTELSSNAIVLGLLNMTATLPILTLSLKGGELADRVEKRRILIVTQVILMMVAFAFSALVFSNRLALWHIFMLGALLGIATAFDLPAAQSMP